MRTLEEIRAEINSHPYDELVDQNLVERRDKLMSWYREVYHKEPLINEVIELEKRENEASLKVKWIELSRLLVDINTYTPLGRKLSKEAQEAVEFEKKPIILKEIGMEDKEVDIRKLPVRDIDQLTWRQLNHLLTIEGNCFQVLVSIQALLSAIAKKQGLDVKKIVDTGDWE